MAVAQAGRRRRALFASAIAGTVLILVAAVVRAGNGDCNDDGKVTVDELVRGIAVALDDGQPGDCPALDIDDNGEVRIEDLIVMVGYLLTGIPALPTPTATPAFHVVQLGAAGGQPCQSTTFSVQVAGETTVEVNGFVIDFCIDPTRFDVLHVTCDTFNPAPRLDRLVLQSSCELDDPTTPLGQVHAEVSGHGGPLGMSLELFDGIDCAIPVFPQTPGGNYPLRYRVASITSEGTVVETGEVVIDVFGVDFVDVFDGGCCFLDTQCQSGFCRAGDPAHSTVCCESGCDGAICNASNFAGQCCSAGGLPDFCDPP